MSCDVGVLRPVSGCGDRWWLAVAKMVDDADVLLEFSKYAAEHWVHVRTRKSDGRPYAGVLCRRRAWTLLGFGRLAG